MYVQKLKVIKVDNYTSTIEYEVSPGNAVKITQNNKIKFNSINDYVNVFINNSDIQDEKFYYELKQLTCHYEDYRLIMTDGIEVKFDTPQQAVQGCNKYIIENEEINDIIGNHYRLRFWSPFPHWKNPGEPWLLKEIIVKEGESKPVNEIFNLADYYNDYVPLDATAKKPKFKWYGHEWIFEGFNVSDYEIENPTRNLDITLKVHWGAHNMHRFNYGQLAFIPMVEDSSYFTNKDNAYISLDCKVARFTRYRIKHSAYNNIYYSQGSSFTQTIAVKLVGTHTENASVPCSIDIFSPGQENDPDTDIEISNIYSTHPLLIVLPNGSENNYGTKQRIGFKFVNDVMHYDYDEDPTLIQDVAVVSDLQWLFPTPNPKAAVLGTKTSHIAMLTEWKNPDDSEGVTWNKSQADKILSDAIVK